MLKKILIAAASALVLVVLVVVGVLWWLGGEGVTNPKLSAIIKPARVYQIEEVHLAKTAATSTLATYSDGLHAAVGKFAAASPGNEAELLLGYTDRQDEASLAAIQRSANRYRQLAADLLELKVPADFREDHLVLLNQASLVGTLVNRMGEPTLEPVAALTAAREFIPAYFQFLVRLLAVKQALAGKGLILDLNFPQLDPLAQNLKTSP